MCTLRFSLTESPEAHSDQLVQSSHREE
uniref:Uncharacterized protein n=1 Tax=Anguilla anguilla TaxID=7936 RepID=A0A0E9PNM8_ANGAN